jgi:RsiW-degrading membrane proteinase PrsW (M82 family)
MREHTRTDYYIHQEEHVAQQSTPANRDRYAKAGYRRNGVWRSAIIAVVALLVFVAIIVALDTALKPQLSGLGLLVAGIVLALVPAGLWLTFFYMQDRVEPEPVGQVARIFVIGLALAGAIGIPLTNTIFRVQDWLYRDTASMLLGSLLIGSVETFIIYATVRYFIFNDAEFDERTDGVVYGTAAALGYATAINLQFFLTSGGSGFGSGEIYVAELALAYAAFGGVIGYFLGHAKLERDPIWWLPLGFLITVLLSGLFFILRGQLETGSIMASTKAALPSVSGLVLAGALAIVVTAVVAFLVNRDIANSLKGAETSVEDPTAGDRQANWATVIVFAVLLVIGIIGWNVIVNGASAFNNAGVSGAYPSSYGLVKSVNNEVLHVADKLGTGAEFIVTTRDLTAGQDVKSISSLLAAQRGANSLIYKTFDTRQDTVNGKPVTVQQFSYVDSSGLTGALPHVTQGTDYIFVTGNKATIVTMLATPETVGDVQPSFDTFVHSLKF